MIATDRHRPDGHDGICVGCGHVLSPSAAVQHFGRGVLTASPADRVRMVLERKAQLADAWAVGVSIPAPRSVFDVERQLRQEGIDVTCKSCRPPVPPRDQWTFVDYLAALSRALDRQITKALKPAPRRRDGLRRGARKTRRRTDG